MTGRLPLFASRRAKVRAARSFVRFVAVALLTLASVPAAHAQLPIAPAPDGTVFVRVAGRGFVKRTSANGDASSLTTWEDPDGRTTWVEYDDLGTVVRWITQERGAVVSGQELRASAAQWNAARDAREASHGAASFRALTAPQFVEYVCAGRPPALPGDVRWVLVAANSDNSPPACSNYVLATSRFDPPDRAPDDVGSVLYDLDGNELATAPIGHTIALETSFFSPTPEAGGRCRERSDVRADPSLQAFIFCAPHNHHGPGGTGLRIWNPIAGAEIMVASGQSFFSAYTNSSGYAELPFHRWQVGPGVLNTGSVGGFYFGEPIDLDYSLSDVSAFIRYSVFNPRSPSSRMTVLNRSPAISGQLFTQYANFAVDTAYLDAILEVRTFTPAGEVRVPLVDTDYAFAEHTLFSPGEVSVGGYGAGLLTQISAADLRDTDVYVFRESDGALIGAREGMQHAEVAGIDLDPVQYPGSYVPAGCRGAACLNVTMVTRGPASATNIGGGYGFDPARGRVDNAGGIDSSYLRRTDTWRRFLRPGDAVRIVAINRASGYVGSLRTIVGILGGRVVIGHPGQRILLGPPTLRVFATRCYDDTSGGTEDVEASCGMGRENVITFEGAGTTGDHYVRIVTEWLDQDGTPLPEELPGFTGRVARSMGDGALVPLGRRDAVETEGDATGLFPIRPGRHTAVVQLPGNDTRQHFYLHVDGSPYERLADFTGRAFQGPSFDVNDVCYVTESGWTCATKEGRDPSLERRPADFVPLQVQVFDADATRALAADRAARLRDEWSAGGGGAPVLGAIERVYAWRYSPEFQFSLYDLDVEQVDVITDGRGTHVGVDYDLDEPADDPLAGLGGDGGLVWGIGGAAIEAPFGRNVNVNTRDAAGDSGGFPSIEALLEGTAGGEAQTLGEQVASLTPEDLLTLGLYDLDDPANPLFELDGLPLVLADVSPLFLERRFQTATFDTRLDGGPDYIDDYRVLPFVAFHPVDVTVRVVRPREDGTDEELAILLEQPNLPPGLQHFVVTADDILRRADVNVNVDPRFVLELEARERGDTTGTPRTHRVRWAGRASIRHDNLKLGQTVVHDVLLQDGSLRLSRQDFALGGLQPALQFSRNYTNIATESDESPLGTGWSHTYDMKLVPLTSEEGTSGSLQSTPQWVRSLEGRFFRESEIPTLPRTWTGVSVNGTVFRKVGARWIPERARHGLLEEVAGQFVFTSEDGTRYFYDQPSFAEPRVSVRADRARISITDPLFFRLGLQAPGREVTAGDPGAPPGSPLPEPVRRIVDRNGNTMTFAYDAEQRVSLVTDATGRTLRFQYGRFPGGVRLLSITALEGDSLQLTVQFGYDERGYLASVTRDGRVETYAYLPENGVMGGGYNLHSATVTPDGVDMFTTVYEYHSAESLGDVLDGFVAGFRAPDVVRSVTYPSREDEGDPDGPTATFAYANARRTVTNARGFSTTYTLNHFGNPIRIEEPNAGTVGGGKIVEMDWSFDEGLPDNLMVARRELGGGRTNAPTYETRWDYTWDEATGRVRQVIETDARGHQSTTTYDLAFGNVLTHTDRNGFTQTWTYDERGNLETHTDATLATWTYESYDDGLRRTVRAPGHEGVTTFTYDAHGNPERVTLPAVTGQPVASTQTDYDVRGRLVASTDANGNTSTRDHDALDNLIRVVLPELTRPENEFPEGRGLTLRRSVEVTTSYDLLGRVTSETDRNGLTLSYEHTARGQVRRVTRSFGGGEKLFRYDDAGNLVFETDWKGVETSHGYDALDRRTTSTNRRGDTMTRHYDAFGNLASVDDFEGNTTAFTYDELDRVASKRRAADRGEHLEFTYFDEADAEANLRTVTVHRAPYPNATYTFTIDGRYQRLSRTGPEGLDEQWTYDPRGDVETFTDSLDRVTRHVYDERRRLREVQQTRREEGAVRVVTVARLGYDAAGNPTTRTDARGLTTTTRYDEWNRPWQVEDAAGFVVSTLRDGEGHVLNVRNPRGFDDTTLRDPLGRVTQHVDALGHTSRVRAYDANSNPEVVENARAVVTRIAYDAEDQEVSVEEGTGAVSPEGTPDYAGSVSARTMEIVERDAMGNVRRVRDARGIETEYQYDASYRLTGVLVDAYPDVPEGETCGATGSSRPSVHRSYAQNGLLLSETNRRCHTTRYEHDARDRVRFVTNARGDQVEQQYDAADRVVRSRNPRGYWTETELDDFDRVTEVAVLDGPTRLVQARYRYDDVGNLRFETDANGNQTEIVYAEDRNLPVRVNLPRVEGEAEAPFRVTTYDANGNPETITNENGQVLTVQYDGLDRLIRSEFGGEVTTYAYDPHGNLRYATPPESQPGGRNAGRVRVMHYDAFDRLERVVEPNGLQTQYRYDPNGNLVGVTDPSNRRTEYRYDRLNRRTHHVVLGPDDGVETDDLVTQWELDANGNARRITDPLGQVVEYEYDELDRRELGTFPVRAPLEHIALESVRWVYDANGNVEGVTATKVAPDVPRWTETTVQRWDALDRLEATTTRGVAIALEYDAAGNRTLVSTAEGSTAYAYDARHRLDYAVVDSERVEYTSLTDGRMDSVLYPNGTRTTYGYHPQTNRLTSLDHERNDGGGWTSFARAEVDWDRNGNRLEDRITIGGVTETTDYEYDVLDRMIQHRRQSSTGGTPETVTYAYSGYERQVERTIPSLNGDDPPSRTRTYTYEPSYGWLTQVDDVSSDGTTTITYGYDRNGNTSWRRNSRNSEEMRFTYDVFDQLQHVERGVVGGGPGTSLGRYDYDVDGRRIRVRGGDRGDVDYYYDGLSVLQEMRPGPTPSDDPTELLAHYRYADRLLSLDRYLGSSGGLARQWYHHDTLGSVMALSAGVAESEAAGTMLASYRYDPYGAIREQTGDSVNRAGFTGHQQDRETGLIYMNARYYDPAIGRFLTADSYLGESGNPPSLQRYLYVFGNPGRWVDPTGHAPVPPRDIQSTRYLDPNQSGGVPYETEITFFDGERVEAGTANEPPETPPAQLKRILSRPLASYDAYTFRNPYDLDPGALTVEEPSGHQPMWEYERPMSRTEAAWRGFGAELNPVPVILALYENSAGAAERAWDASLNGDSLGVIGAAIEGTPLVGQMIQFQRAAEADRIAHAFELARNGESDPQGQFRRQILATPVVGALLAGVAGQFEHTRDVALMMDDPDALVRHEAYGRSAGIPTRLVIELLVMRGAGGLAEKVAARNGIGVADDLARAADDVSDIGDEAAHRAARELDDPTASCTWCIDGKCFVAGTLVATGEGLVEVERLRVGDRVLNEDGGSDTAVDATWQVVELEMPNREVEGDVLEISMLRPRIWWESMGVHREGDQLHLSTDDIGQDGWATVRAIRGAPEVMPGEGRVILGTVTHVNRNVHELRFVDTDVTLRATGEHRFYSLDRLDWVATQELRSGERLQSEHGPLAVASVVRLAAPERVYNVEVETDHEYLVTELGVRSHNNDICRLYREVDLDHARSVASSPAEIPDPRLVVDMPFVGQGLPSDVANAAGFARDAGAYWAEIMMRHPEAFSPFNRDVLVGRVPGMTAPVNDAVFRSVFTHFDQPGLRGKTMVHHHIGGGGQAVAIPSPLHRGFGGVHNTEKALGVYGGDAAVAAVLQRLLMASEGR